MTAAAAEPPLVTIGVPTYNRAATLPLTVRSALDQTHENLEVVIADNASTDATPELCGDLARRDSRVRYLSQPRNLGPTANFNTLFAAARGDFVMMLADDDWLDARYVARCLEHLEDRPDHALVCGLARYHRGGRPVGTGVEMQLEQPSPAARVRAYYRAVEDNGTFYGLMPRSVLRDAAPLPNLLGNDWLLVARVAFTGKVRTLPDVSLHRSLDGTSASIASITHTFGAPALQARVPHLYMAWYAFADVTRGWPGYAALSRPARVALGAVSAWSVIDWKSLAWHLSAPTMLGLGRRRRTRWLYRLYDRFTRALGAGRSV